jgi:excinuclease ABC subunit A
MFRLHPQKACMSSGVIRIRGARQHNLKNLDLDIRTGELTVVTGPSGSGKSSLVFDTLYAEGQRRYVETFSAYARQFLDRMDRPAVDRVDGVPPAIAIDQTNPVRTSRSTVGTMTELNDHLKLLFARAGQLFDQQTALPVRHDTPETIYADLGARAAAAGDPRLIFTFPVELPADTTAEQQEQWLAASGFTRVQTERLEGPRKILDVVADRLRLGSAEKIRVTEAIELALKRGGGRLTVHAGSDGGALWRYSTGLHCPESDRRYADPQPAMFSFNSAYGACDTCRGFGRVIGVDFGLVIPDVRKTLRSGAIRPMQTPAWKDCQSDLLKYAGEAGIPRDTAWNQLTEAQRHWVIEGSPHWTGHWNKQWYGVRRFFGYLESKAYKMHIRVLLSKYRSYTPCTVCGGARLKLEALLWRIGSQADADAVLPPARRLLPQGVGFGREALEALPGLCLHDLMQLSIERLRRFFDGLTLPSTMLDDALKLLLDEVRARLKYLCDVGLQYLTLDRQSRTLSGGEVQRINLTTALGTSLVNTMFVLDELSIGLHPRDMNRIVQAMHRLRDAGNTLVVVEHDPAVMLAADRLIDMGPGPGERGGRIVFDGTPEEARHANTLTGAYLGGRKQVASGFRRLVDESTPKLLLEGVREHNLRNVSVSLPLQRLVCVTGVSGSGKSTLIQDVLYPALARHFGKATETPGAFERLLGADRLSDAVFVDQSPIGKTARSNPASYVGAFDEMRKLFAELPLARERSYSAGSFSFNAGDGRCPTCGGSGFEHVEMQFLSDVYLRCPDCDGRRYRAEILDVKIVRGPMQYSIADVLDLTVAEAAHWFQNDREVTARLQPIIDVGLDYVRLGQPVPTLSGGEAQRLKLAGFLAEAASSASSYAASRLARRGTLFLFDEPTTGLHFDDIAKLMRALRKLLDAGHSLLVIEHNLDVVRAADWVVDLGPEGGEAGGEVVCTGTPDDIKAHPSSHTGAALRDYEQSLGFGTPRAEEGRALQSVLRAARRARQDGDEAIRIVNAREHNLQSLSVDIPRGKFNVVTGVSGSGKSTLAFDILFNEGQRRYLESLNAYARSIVQPAGRPEVDAVYGIPPTVAIEQRLSRGGRKSTVATTTEVWHFLRLLWVKLGLQHCTKDGAPVKAQSAESIAAQLLRDHRGQHVGLLAPLVVNRKGVYTDLAKWAKARGHTHLRVDGEFLPLNPFPRIDRFKEHTLELPVGDIVIAAENEPELRALLSKTLDLGKGVLHLLQPLDGLAEAMNVAGGGTGQGLGKVKVFSTKRACPVCGTSYPELDPRMFSYNSKHGWCTGCVGTGLKLTREQRKTYDDSVRDDDNKGREQSFPAEEAEAEGLVDEPCADCGGARLNAASRGVTFKAQAINDIAARSVRETRQWVEALQLAGRDADIARDVVSEIRSRLEFLEDVGLGYLTLDRAAPTLSGGEAQRIRLAAQLGSNLQGVCYVLDEPTIGLHPRDNGVLLKALAKLGDKGNTLVVVEHDEDTIRRADHLIDIGPGAGKRGGRLVAEGSVAELARHPSSVTGRLLAHPLRHPIQPRRGVDAALPALWLRGASLHNLQDIDVWVPLCRLVAVTGVSGSGKSTLARDVLLANVAAQVAKKANKAGREALAAGRLGPLVGCGGLTGFEVIDRVLEVDQTPIGKTPRSCPATYIGFWDAIRKLFTETLEARARGYGAARFSFNTGDGRCPGCEGQGMKTSP